MKDVRNLLDIKIESPYWDEAYALALSEPEIPQWLTEEYIRRLHDECNVFPKNLEKVISVIPHVTAIPELCLLAKTIYHILGKKRPAKEAFTSVQFPKAPKGISNTIGYDCFAIFPLIGHLRPTLDELEARGVDNCILRESLFWVDSLFTDCCKRLGRPAFAETEFMMHRVAIYVNQLIIGCLRFELGRNVRKPARMFINKQGDLCCLMCDTVLHHSGHILGSYHCTDAEGAFSADFEETAEAYIGYTVDEGSRLVKKERITLSKADWSPVFVPGDDIVKIHISYGAKISREGCRNALERAREVIPRCYPEFNFVGFTTCCWMLSPQLRNILSPNSNIIGFQDHFYVFPSMNQAQDAFLYAFNISNKSVDEICFSELPETNSLMRGIKAKALAGEFIYEFHGFIPR